MEELGKLHFHFFALEHVVLGLLADGRDQVELPGNGVGLLGKAKRGVEGPCRSAVLRGLRGSREKTQRHPQERLALLPLPSPLSFPGSLLGPPPRVEKSEWVVGSQG